MKLTNLVAHLSIPPKFNYLPIDVVNNVYKEFCYANVCEGCKWEEE